MNVNKLKEKITLHPIMTLLMMIGFTIVLSGILHALGVQATSRSISTSSLEYNIDIQEVKSLLSLAGLKYIFTSTVSNFMSFAPLSSFIIILIGIGIMQKSGFLRVAFTLLTKNAKKVNVTFILVLIGILLGMIGDISFIILLPISAILFEVGKRNPVIGIVASYAALTCGYGINIVFTSIDSSLTDWTTLAAHVLDSNYTISTLSFLFIMFVVVCMLAFLITRITERYTVYKVDKYEALETEFEEELLLDKKQKKGLALAFIAFMIYFLIFLYNIIPGLPFSGKFLDNSQAFYIDKLFSYNSFFSSGFVFIVTIGMIIIGLFYGIGAKTIKNHHEFCNDLGHSLDGIGRILVLIFFASILVNVVKETNIGVVVVTGLSNLLNNTTFTAMPLILLLFLVSAISTVFLPSSLSRWSILSGMTVPVFMNAGISPEFTQLVFRFGECTTIGLTPLFAYFVIYLALLEKYNQKEQPVNFLKAIKYQIPFVFMTFALLLTILIVWYIVGLPIGVGVSPTL